MFSTLHTNGAIPTITRLIDMGIKPFMLSGALNAVIAQRLTRRLCDNCKKKTILDEKVKTAFKLNVEKEITVYEALGCSKCHNIGYKGRVVISEVLFITEELNLVISTEPTIRNITEAAKKENFIPMQKDAIQKVLDGVTSFDEIIKTLDMTAYTRSFIN